jgi:hypothetical protein
MTEEKTPDALAGRLFGAVLGTIDMLTVYLGDRLGYYKVLVETGPVTSTELAHRAGTQERYAREWLEQQAITGILDVDDVAAPAGERRYSIPPGHGEALTDELSLAYVAPFGRLITAAAVQLPGILEAHRTGGGVSWDQYGNDMREAQAQGNRPFFAEYLGSTWFPSVPEIHDVLEGGARVAEIGPGFGWSSIAVAAAYPGVTIDGYDVDAPSVVAANANAAEHGLSDRVRFHVVDASAPPADDTYDMVMGFEFVHDLPYPVEVLATMRRLAGESGLVVVMDEKVAEDFGAIGDDVERLMYGFSNLVCLPDGMSHPGSAGTGTVMRPAVLERYARDAGFGGVEVLPIETDLWRFYRLI